MPGAAPASRPGPQHPAPGPADHAFFVSMIARGRPSLYHSSRSNRSCSPISMVRRSTRRSYSALISGIDASRVTKNRSSPSLRSLNARASPELLEPHFYCSYQAAILLCSQGLSTEARMLSRSCFENAFCIAALVKDPAKLIKALEDDDKAAQKAQAKFIAEDPARMVNLDPKAKKRLQKFASTVDQQWGKVRQLAIDETAKSTALREAYLFYRVLSNDSCHPSASSLSQHIVAMTDGHWDYQLGPALADRIADALNIACHAIISALVAFTELVHDADGNREVAVAVDAYCRVNHAIVDAQQKPSA